MKARQSIVLAFVAAAAFASSAKAEDALYKDLGERPGIAKIVDDATANFLSDDRIKATFDNTNMDRFKVLLTDQLCVVAGRPVRLQRPHHARRA